MHSQNWTWKKVNNRSKYVLVLGDDTYSIDFKYNQYRLFRNTTKMAKLCGCESVDEAFELAEQTLTNLGVVFPPAIPEQPQTRRQVLINELQEAIDAVKNSSDEEIAELDELDEEFEDFVMYVPGIVPNIKTYKTLMPLLRKIVQDTNERHPLFCLKVVTFTYHVIDIECDFKFFKKSQQKRFMQEWETHNIDADIDIPVIMFSQNEKEEK